MNIQQRKQIIDDAPDGATHYVVLQYDMIEAYWKLTGGCVYTLDESGEKWVYREDMDANGYYHIDELDLYRTIVEQHEEIERLQDELAALENNIGMALSHNSMSYLLESTKENSCAKS